MHEAWLAMAMAFMTVLQVASAIVGGPMALRLKDIREFLYEVRLKWYDLGIELDCDITDLDVIKLMHQNPKDCLREMIKNRLKFVDNPLTWSAIAKALSAAAVDEEELACKALANAQGEPYDKLLSG